MTKALENRILTPEFRVSYPVVFEPKLNQLSGKTEYSMVLLFSKKTDISGLKKLAQKVAKEKWGDKPPVGLYSPFRDGDTERPGREEYKNTIFMSVRSKIKPGLVDENAQIILDPSQFYAGCYAHAYLSCFAFDVNVKKGISFGLQNIQKLRDGEPLVSRRSAEDDFAPITESDIPEGAVKVTSLYEF